MDAADLTRWTLRALVGSTMLAHGIRHARTLEGTARWFGGIGFRRPELQARTSAVVEIGSGAALVAGVATPAACSAVIGTMAVAARSVHIDNGYFVVNEGYEYVLTVAALSAALAALGPGPVSVDRASGVEPRLAGPRMGALAVLGGVAGAAAQLAVFWRRPTRS